MDKHHCCTPVREPYVAPFRSTFCYINTTNFYLAQKDIIALKEQWAKFEAIENHDSIIYNRLVNSVPTQQGTCFDKLWYKFSNDTERQIYLKGQAHHLAEYPSVSDFQIPYSKKLLTYSSTVLQTLSTIYPSSIINTQPISSIASTIVALPSTSSQLNPKQQSSDEVLKNRTAQNIYVRVSTQNSLFPKSPYRFSGNNEYLLFKTYASVYAPRPLVRGPS
jgi:hypothetical protein